MVPRLVVISSLEVLLFSCCAGLGDFEPFELSWGEAMLFWGSQCRHYAPENTTERTRISLDFRVIVEGDFIENYIHPKQVPFPPLVHVLRIVGSKAALVSRGQLGFYIDDFYCVTVLKFLSKIFSRAGNWSWRLLTGEPGTRRP